jgi:hypothetical protein
MNDSFPKTDSGNRERDAKRCLSGSATTSLADHDFAHQRMIGHRWTREREVERDIDEGTVTLLENDTGLLPLSRGTARCRGFSRFVFHGRSTRFRGRRR